jgi:hypothetical protein
MRWQGFAVRDEEQGVLDPDGSDESMASSVGCARPRRDLLSWTSGQDDDAPSCLRIGVVLEVDDPPATIVPVLGQCLDVRSQMLSVG